MLSVAFGLRQFDCALSCMSCNCFAVIVCSVMLARASTLTCRLFRQLFAACKVLLSCALIKPKSGTLCCSRLQTSSRFCWVSFNFSAYSRSIGGGLECHCGLAVLASETDPVARS